MAPGSSTRHPGTRLGRLTRLATALPLGGRGTTAASGHGVGLHVVRTLVERMGGTSVLEDRAGGAFFAVNLPRA